MVVIFNNKEDLTEIAVKVTGEAFKFMLDNEMILKDRISYIYTSSTLKRMLKVVDKLEDQFEGLEYT